MNLKQKEELKLKMERIEDLLTCVDADLIYEDTYFESNKIGYGFLGHMAFILHGDKKMVLNILLRMIKQVVKEIKQECEQ